MERRRVRIRNVGQRGFTLIEALLSTMIISVSVMAVSAAFYGGFENLRDEGRLLEKVNHATGKMDELIATEFSSIANGSDLVTVGGEQIQRQWQATPADVDGNPGVEQDARIVVVRVDDIKFTTIVVDSAGQVTCKW